LKAARFTILLSSIPWTITWLLRDEVALMHPEYNSWWAKWILPDSIATKATAENANFAIQTKEYLVNFFGGQDENTMLEIKFYKALEPKPSMVIEGRKWTFSLAMFEDVVRLGMLEKRTYS
jgi:hypothetical protein